MVTESYVNRINKKVRITLTKNPTSCRKGLQTNFNSHHPESHTKETTQTYIQRTVTSQEQDLRITIQQNQPEQQEDEI